MHLSNAKQMNKVGILWIDGRQM